MRTKPARFDADDAGGQLKERILRIWGATRPQETNALLWLALILGLALVIRVAWVLVSQTTPVSEASVYDRLAWSLASNKEYVAEDGTPTAFRPVGYPVFLAGVYTAFGHSWTAGGIVNALLGTAAVGLTYVLARTVLSVRLSLVAALLIALLPSHILGYTAVLRMEALHTVFVLSALVITYWAVRAPRAQNVVLLGLCLGIGVYVRPILLLYPVAFGAVLALQPQISLRRAIGLAGAAGLVMLLVLLPWTVRNYIVMDAFVLTSTHGGINLLVGNGPDAIGQHETVDGSIFSDTSEMTVYRESIRIAFGHIVSHPLAWFKLLPRKFFYLWASDADWVTFARAINLSIFQDQFHHWIPGLKWFTQFYWAAIALMAAGAVVTRPLRYWSSFPANIFPVLIVYWTAFHMAFFGMGRFHAQVIPVIVVIAVHLLSKDRDWLLWVRQFQHRSSQANTTPY